MSFFTSEYSCKLDAKGRLVLPSKIKSSLPESSGNELVIGRGFDPCLVLYPMIEFKKIMSRFSGLNEFNAENRMLQRNFFRSNVSVELDNAGRFLIPKLMLNYAQIDKDAVLVGMHNKVEIWNPEVYEKYLINDPDEFSKLVQKQLDE